MIFGALISLVVLVALSVLHTPLSRYDAATHKDIALTNGQIAAASLLNAVLYALLIGAGAFVYFLPAVVGQHKRNATSILLLNLFLGWTVLGWIAALVWAATKENQVQRASTTVTVPSSVLCSSCGKRSAPGGIFCPHCAAKL